MKLLRIRIIIFACWLAAFYSMERLLSDVDISNITYALVLTTVMVLFITPRKLKISLPAILSINIILFLGLKILAGELKQETPVSFIAFELSAIIITTILAYWMISSLREFETSVEKITIGRREIMAEPDSKGQGYIYREVRRARNHQRPLALMTITVDEKSVDVDFDRMMKEVQLSIMKQYKMSELSNVLCDQLEDCAIIVHSDKQFLIALPETRPEELPVIVDRLRQRAAGQLGVNLHIGTASLPQDGYTFEGLLYKATYEMQPNHASIEATDQELLPAKDSVIVKQSYER